MAEHTPGPWRLAGAMRDTVYDPDNRFVAALPMDLRSSERLANARLIAPAPDLLAALQELVTRCDGEQGVRADGSNIDTLAAHAAITKAEGRDAS